jgi:hypothetical protein
MAWATAPAPATARATANRRLWATSKTATVAAGVAAGESAASTLNAAAPATGQRNVTGTSAQLITPTTTARTSTPVEPPELACPQTVSPVRALMPSSSQALRARSGYHVAPGRRGDLGHSPSSADVFTWSSLRPLAPGTTPAKVGVRATFVGPRNRLSSDVADGHAHPPCTYEHLPTNSSSGRSAAGQRQTPTRGPCMNAIDIEHLHKRYGAKLPSTTSASVWGPARSSASSVRTGPARPRRSNAWKACGDRTEARSRCLASTPTVTATNCASALASSYKKANCLTS